MLILFDSNQLCYAGHFASQNGPQQLSYKGMNTSVIFYFLKTVLGVYKKYGTSNMVFCWDSKKSNRKVLFPPYKEKRRENMTEEERRLLDEAFVQFMALRMVVLPSMGFANIFRKTGYESDDIIASVALHAGDEEEVVIVSSDHDFYQLLGPGTTIYDPKKGVERDHHWFRREFAVGPAEWSTVLAVAGCSTDNVPGVPGVGVKTAIKYLHGELDGKSKVVGKIRESLEDIDFYYQLVNLPLEGTGTFELRENYLGEKRVWENFEYYGFHSFMREEGWAEWQSLINDRPLEKKMRRRKRLAKRDI